MESFTESLPGYNSDDSRCSEDYDGSTFPDKKRNRNKHFDPKWLDDPEFKDWLQPCLKEGKVAKCGFCEWEFKHCSRGSLLHHKQTAKHQKNLRKSISNTSEDNMCTIEIKVDEDSENPDCDSPKKMSKRWYPQKFKKSWMNLPQLRDWLRPDPTNPYGSFCTACDIKLTGNKSGLFSHGKTSKHRKNLVSKNAVMRSNFDDDEDDTKRFKNERVVVSIPSSGLNTDTENYIEDVPVAMAEHFQIGYLAVDGSEENIDADYLFNEYIAEYKVPFEQADHLVGVIRKMFPTDQDAQNLTFDRSKVSSMAQDKIVWEDKGMLIHSCKHRVFSLIIDEYLGRSSSHVMAVVVRFFDNKECKVTEGLLGVVEVHDPSADRLYQVVKSLLRDNGIPLKNIMGFASDPCSTKPEMSEGVQGLIKRDLPSVYILNCISYSFLLCCSEACQIFSPSLEDFVKNCCEYLSKNNNGGHQFSKIESAFDAPKYKILKVSQTSWLSRSAVISRILGQWDELQQFFMDEANLSEGEASEIHDTMLLPGVKHLLLFLNYILPKINKMDSEFQSEYFCLSTLHSSITAEYKTILELFVRDEVFRVTDLAHIDPFDTSVHKKLEDINLGGRCEAMIIKVPLEDQLNKFRNECLNFLMELCSQMRTKFNFKSDSVLSQMKYIDPEEALSHRRASDAVMKIAIHFPNLIRDEDLDKLQDQWIQLLKSKDSLTITSKPARFWSNLKTIVDDNKEPKFGLLSSFMCKLMVLPQSSAYVERIFSQLNDV